MTGFFTSKSYPWHSDGAADTRNTGSRKIEMRLKSTLTNWVRDERGATAIEYGLIAALIAVVVISAVTSVGNNLSKKFSNIANSVK
jgi:pilus assembly protein Flp/PilA